MGVRPFGTFNFLSRVDSRSKNLLTQRRVVNKLLVLVSRLLGSRESSQARRGQLPGLPRLAANVEAYYIGFFHSKTCIQMKRYSLC